MSSSTSKISSHFANKRVRCKASKLALRKSHRSSFCSAHWLSVPGLPNALGRWSLTGCNMSTDATMLESGEKARSSKLSGFPEWLTYVGNSHSFARLKSSARHLSSNKKKFISLYGVAVLESNIAVCANGRFRSPFFSFSLPFTPFQYVDNVEKGPSGARPYPLIKCKDRSVVKVYFSILRALISAFELHLHVALFGPFWERVAFQFHSKDPRNTPQKFHKAAWAVLFYSY